MRLKKRTIQLYKHVEPERQHQKRNISCEDFNRHLYFGVQACMQTHTKGNNIKSTRQKVRLLALDRGYEGKTIFT